MYITLSKKNVQTVVRKKKGGGGEKRGGYLDV